MSYSSWAFPEVHFSHAHMHSFLSFLCCFSESTEHAVVLSKLYVEKKEAIRTVLKSDSLRLTKLEEVTGEVKQGIAGDKYSIDMPYAEVNLRIRKEGEVEDQKICMTKDKLNDLICQLHEVRELMTTLR